jgi:hypothetical protein
MKPRPALTLLAACAALAACGAEKERSFNEIWNETDRSVVGGLDAADNIIANSAAGYEARAENEVRAAEQRLEAEAEAQMSRLNATEPAPGNESVNGQ